MGGYGSGRHAGKVLADNCLALDLGMMIRTGLAVPGQDTTGTLHWSCRGEPFGSLAYTAEMADRARACLILSFTRTVDGQQNRYRQVVRLDSTRPHFGGERWWMLCPYSGRRVRMLYKPPHHATFAARQYWNLAYRSQREAKDQRPYERLFRLQRKMSSVQGYEAGLKRPKGMWHSNFARHWRHYLALEDACHDIWCDYAARLLAKKGRAR